MTYRVFANPVTYNDYYGKTLGAITLIPGVRTCYVNGLGHVRRGFDRVKRSLINAS